MPPQVANMELLLSSELPQHQLASMDMLKENVTLKTFEQDSERSSDGSFRSRRKKYLTKNCATKQDPFRMIRNLLFPGGASMAYCNEETLSSSFLILDGFMTISLSDASSSVLDATERWGKRLETNICVGKVSYEYRLSDEVERNMNLSSSTDEGEEEVETKATILSQNLEKIPLVLDQEPSEDGTLLDPDRYLPPSHKMVADALKFQEYDEAVDVYEDILQADKERYGESDLVCAIDYHNLGVASLLASDLDSALYYFQEAVILKRACLGQKDATVSESLVEIGIILFYRNDCNGALRIFKEALELYNDASNTEGVGRTSNNIGCVYYKMGDVSSALSYLYEALISQRMVLGMSEKAESSLLNIALTQSNVGFLKMEAGHLDAAATLEESLLVLESVMGDENSTVTSVRDNITLAKQRQEIH